jgi:aminoglycoside phosphotransferase (APT) family kinase protein
MVMELLAGRPFLRGRAWHQFPRDLRRLVISWPAVFARVLDLLMRVDTAPVTNVLSAHGIAAEAARTGRHLAWVEEVLGATPAFGTVISWLKANQPEEPERPCLVHGDLWPGNVLMQKGALSGLVDWTMGTIGDPALEVGFAKVGLALMPEPFPPPWPISRAIRASGVHIARQIHERCRSLVGGDDRIAYYEALRCVVQLAMVQADRERGVRNGWEHGVPALSRHLHEITGHHTTVG